MTDHPLDRRSTRSSPAQSTSRAASARAPARPASGWLPDTDLRRARARRLASPTSTATDLHRLPDGPGPADPRPPAAGRLEAVTRDDQRARLALRARHDLEAPGRRRRLRADAVDRAAALRQLGHRVRACTRCASPAPRPGARLIVRFEGHYHGWSDAIHWSAHPDARERRARRRSPPSCPARPAWPAGVAATLLVAAVERRRRAGARSSPSTATRSPRSSPSRSWATAAAILPAPGLPRAAARADARSRRAADLRRGADRASASAPAAPRSCSASSPT